MDTNVLFMVEYVRHLDREIDTTKEHIELARENGINSSFHEGCLFALESSKSVVVDWLIMQNVDYEKYR